MSVDANRSNLPPGTPTAHYYTDPMLRSAQSKSHNKPLTVAIVDQTRDVEVAARDYAEARLREESEAAEKGGKIKGFLHRIWRGENGIATKYFFNKYIEEARGRAEKEGLASLYTDEAELRNAAMGATIARFTSEYDEAVHDVAGERREELAADSPFGLSIKKLIQTYVEGDGKDWSEEAFREAQARIMRKLNQYGDGDGLIGEGKVRIDNTWQIAQAVKESVSHGESLDNILQGMKIYTGESRSGVRTEAYQSKVDKAIEKLQKTKIGSLVGPETLSLGAAIATGIFRVGRGSLMRAAGVTGIPGLIGGVFAGARENKRLKEERALHAREVAQGKIVPGEGFKNKGRRTEIEKTRYETVSAGKLIDSLKEFVDKDNLSPEELQRCYESLVNAQARVLASDRYNVDFISYSSVTDVESERFELDVMIAQAKVKLGNRLGDLPESFRNDLGIDEKGTVDDAIRKSTEVLESLDNEISKKDEVFKKLRRRRVAQAAVAGVVAGFTIGLAAQELTALVDSNYDGAIEHALAGEGKGDRQTLLEGLFHGHGGPQADVITASETYTSYDVGADQGSISLPDNYQLIHNPDGTVNIIDPNGNIFADNLSLETDGSLSQAAQEALQEKGAVIEDLSAIIEGKESAVQDLTLSEYLDYHQSDTTDVIRDFWYDNNTAEFDGNELSLHWGGDHGLGPDGSINLSVSEMADGRSYHGADDISWLDQAQNGTLKFAVSASQDSQDRVFMVDIAPDGAISIPQDSPVAGLFSVGENGQVEFNGGYGEVVELRGTEDGITHVAPLATIEGTDSISTIRTTVDVSVDKIAPKFQITPPPVEVGVATDLTTVEGFGGPAVVTRRPLENIAKNRADGNRYGYGYGYNLDRHETQLEDISPRLKEDRNASLELGEETARYRQWLSTSRGASHVNQLDQVVNNSPELQQAPGDIDFIATIPVAAVSESENIYNTLSLLAQQDRGDIEKSLVLLNVNWLDSARSDPEKAANILKTMAEIDRARKDFPHLRVATIEREYSREAVEKTGGVIGYVAQDLQSAALLWLQQQIETGKRSPDQDAIIQRYDADMRGMSRHAWRDVRRAANKYPETDIFKGVTRFGTDRYEDYPGFGITAEVVTTMDTLAARGGHVSTGGANFGVRASSLAAVNGVGDVNSYSGAGSDDTGIGARIHRARGQVSSQRIGRLVAGSTVDTDAQRLITAYSNGRQWQSVWNIAGQPGSFSDDSGGYIPRTENQPKGQGEAEKLSNKALETFELNMSTALSYSSPEYRARALSLVFKNVPGAYILEETSSGEVKFSLTEAGRNYVKNYIRGDKSRLPFGKRVRQQLYGYRRNNRSRSGALISAES